MAERATVQRTREGVPIVERTKRSWVQANLPTLLTGPAFLVPTLLTVVAIIGNYFALTDMDMRFGIRNYLGLGNFFALFRDKYFTNAVRVSLTYAALALAIEVPTGFLMSMALDRAFAPLAKFARALIVIPMCIAPVIATMMWKIMMGPTQGVFNFILVKLGLPMVDFLGDSRVVILSLVLIDAWIYIPFVILVFWSGWQTLPKPPFEAAALDGATGWFVFRRLTLPLMQPFIMIVFLFRMCDTLNAFDTIFVSTKGGPNISSRTLSILAMDNGMTYYHLGYGVSITIVLGFIVNFIVRRLFAFWRRAQIGAE